MITLEKDGESSEDLGLAISPSNCLSQYTLGLEGLEVDQSVHAPQLYPLPEGLQVKGARRSRNSCSTNDDHVESRC